LALLWSTDVEVKLESYDKLHIDVIVKPISAPRGCWRFTGFYGEARRELRHRSWDLLRWLSTRSVLPWLCAGDFNEVLHANEQFGGQGRSERQMEGFREAVEICGFNDLGYIGLPYTWDNRQPVGHNIKVRLDRGFANAEFFNLFQSIRVWHIQTTVSDHCCLLLDCRRGGSARSRRKHQFLYENMWKRDPSYKDMVEQA
jgi:hypothetical protein